MTCSREHTSSDPWALSLKQLAFLYAEHPDDPAIRAQIEEWKLAILNQIYLIAGTAPTEKTLTKEELLVIANEVKKRRALT